MGAKAKRLWKTIHLFELHLWGLFRFVASEFSPIPRKKIGGLSSFRISMKISGFEPETDTNIDLKKLALNVRFQKQRNELYFT